MLVPRRCLPEKNTFKMATYICSLSKKETCDPVVAPNGYVYDKKCIESRSF
jgi:hypothetical protein